MKYLAYPRYKASGVEWLGDVPDRWEVEAIKWASPVLRGASPRPIDDPIYFDDDGEYAWVRISDVTASGMYLYQTEQRLSDLGSSLSVKLDPGALFLSIAGSVGKPCINRIKCCIHDGFVFFPRFKGDSRFLYYVFASGEPYGGLGKLGTQLNLNTDTVGSIVVGFPEMPEQRAIADFLDQETEGIDRLVAKKRDLVEKLKEKRIALISRTVTRGLPPEAARAAGFDPNPPFKPSGIEWIGEIPDHWEIKRLGKLALSLQTGPFGSQLHFSDYIEDGIPVINPVHLNTGKIVPDKECSVDEPTFERLERHQLQMGDIIFGRRGEMGRCALVTKEADGFLCGTGCLRVRLDKRVADPLFISLYLGIAGVRDYLVLESVGSTMDNLNTSILSRIPVVLPPISEQRLIAEYAIKRAESLSCATEAITTSIRFFLEYRTALITAAVTGKIDVSNVWTQPEAQASRSASASKPDSPVLPEISSAPVK